MEERILQLESEVRFLKDVIFKDNFESTQIFKKDVEFKGKIAFFGKQAINQAAAIAAPTTPGGAYSQSEAQSAVNAINSLRTAVKNLGLTA